MFQLFYLIVNGWNIFDAIVADWVELLLKKYASIFLTKMEQESQIKSAAINLSEVEKSKSIAPLEENLDFFSLNSLPSNK